MRAVGFQVEVIHSLAGCGSLFPDPAMARPLPSRDVHPTLLDQEAPDTTTGQEGPWVGPGEEAPASVRPCGSVNLYVNLLTRILDASGCNRRSIERRFLGCREALSSSVVGSPFSVLNWRTGLVQLVTSWIP